jgi:hypothetical protein
MIIMAMRYEPSFVPQLVAKRREAFKAAVKSLPPASLEQIEREKEGLGEGQLEIRLTLIVVGVATLAIFGGPPLAALAVGESGTEETIKGLITGSVTGAATAAAEKWAFGQRKSKSLAMPANPTAESAKKVPRTSVLSDEQEISWDALSNETPTTSRHSASLDHDSLDHGR